MDPFQCSNLLQSLSAPFLLLQAMMFLPTMIYSNLLSCYIFYPLLLSHNPCYSDPLYSSLLKSELLKSELDRTEIATTLYSTSINAPQEVKGHVQNKLMISGTTKCTDMHICSYTHMYISYLYIHTHMITYVYSSAYATYVHMSR